MARTAPRARPDREQVLETVHAHCPACGGRLRYRYDNRHTVTTLAGLVRLRLRIRRCEDPGCARYRRPYRPEAEGALVLPQHEFGLDVIALIGALGVRGVLFTADALHCQKNQNGKAGWPLISRA